MVITNISDAKASLSQLVERAARGERIVIGKAGKPMAVLVAYARDPAPRELGGDWEGRVLGSRARTAMIDARNPVFVSDASVWEIGIKRALGKLLCPARLAISRAPCHMHT